jgi:MFS family permease
MSNIVCGFAKNVFIMIFFRIIQSIGISAAVTLGGGIVGDVFIPDGKINLFSSKYLFLFALLFIHFLQF